LKLFSTKRHIPNGMWKTEVDKYFIKRLHFDFLGGQVIWVFSYFCVPLW